MKVRVGGAAGEVAPLMARPALESAAGVCLCTLEVEGAHGTAGLMPACPCFLLVL